MDINSEDVALAIHRAKKNRNDENRKRFFNWGWFKALKNMWERKESDLDHSHKTHKQ